MLTSSIIIPTYNRPKELENCIKSLLEQTTRPDELIIIDDGQLSEPPLEKKCRDNGIKYVYQRKDVPGLTKSRNLGIQLASGNIIFFFDDDTIMAPDYIENIMEVYSSDPERHIGGVSGIIANTKPLTSKQRIKRIIQLMFLMSGFREGRVLPSGFTTNFDAKGTLLKEKREVDFLPGCAMSFRSEIFREISFDGERYLNYGLGEDKDFSYQVSKKYKLVINPEAKLMHLESPKMRVDEFRESRMFLLDRYLFFTRHVKKGWWSWIYFFYAIFGYIMMSFFAFLVSPGRDASAKLSGIFSAAKDIISNNVKVV
jgi:glucosyl-dolichyl phosphate glucuronosyltransferase